jgi:hypothetical protein
MMFASKRDDGFQAYAEGDEAPAHEHEHDLVLYENQKAPSRNDTSLALRGTQFYFNIGSVETFERSLLEAQQRAGVQPEDYVPVCGHSFIINASW